MFKIIISNFLLSHHKSVLRKYIKYNLEKINVQGAKYQH